MLSWALTFFVLALIAAVLGFGGLAAGMAGIAKILFFIFLVIFVLTLIGHTMRGTPVVYEARCTAGGRCALAGQRHEFCQ